MMSFASLLLVEGLGPRTLQSLAFIAEVVHEAPSRFSDPARFSFVHGGKHGHPFPVPLKTYDESLAVLRRRLEAARLADTRKMDGFRPLDRLTRAAEEDRDPFADFGAVLACERKISSSLGRRTVFDDRASEEQAIDALQLDLF
jgi:hypothetical protein